MVTYRPHKAKPDVRFILLLPLGKPPEMFNILGLRSCLYNLVLVRVRGSITNTLAREGCSLTINFIGHSPSSNGIRSGTEHNGVRVPHDRPLWLYSVVVTLIDCQSIVRSSILRITANLGWKNNSIFVRLSI